MDITSRFSVNGNGDTMVLEPEARAAGNGVEEKESKGKRAGARKAAPNGEREGATAASKEGRDEGGRFAAGNKGGPGNPYNRRVAKLKVWLAEVVDEAGIKAAGKKLLEMAIEGDVPAARVLFQYVMPKHVEPDMVDVEEWEGIKKKSGMFAEMPKLLNKPGPELALDIVRAAQPLMTERLRGMTVNLLQTPQERLGEVQEMLRNDPKSASEYLNKGPGVFFGKGKGTRRERKAAQGKRRKR